MRVTAIDEGFIPTRMGVRLPEEQRRFSARRHLGRRGGDNGIWGVEEAKAWRGCMVCSRPSCLHFATDSAGQKTIQGGAIGKFRFLAWRVAARGARVVVDSTLPLVFVPIRILMCHANR